MAQYRIGNLQSGTAGDETGVETAEASFAPESLASDVTSAVPQDTPPRLAHPPIVPDSWLASAGPAGVTALVRDTPSSGVPVLRSEGVLDESSPGEIAAEIAHLQELILGLTQNVEWRNHDRQRR